MSLKLIMLDRSVFVDALVEDGRLTLTAADGTWLQIEGLTADHIIHNGEPGVIRAKRSGERRHFTERGLSLMDLDPALSPATLKAMLAEHFILSGLPDIAEAVMLDYKALTKKEYKPQAIDSDPQLAADLAKVAPIADELFDDEGELVWGGQTRIAEALDIPNGGAYRARILAVVEALQQKEAA